jgi:molybdopterin biosynthesis enzyme MoaB
MTAASAPNSAALVSAALLVIGDEILSGRTKDKNIGYIAEYLTALGIDLKEVRVVATRRARSSRAQRAARPLHLRVHDRRHRADA